MPVPQRVEKVAKRVVGLNDGGRPTWSWLIGTGGWSFSGVDSQAGIEVEGSSSQNQNCQHN